VERAMIVFEWFVDKHEIIDKELKDLENKVNYHKAGNCCEI